MTNVVSIFDERRKRRRSKPHLGLLGVRSDALTILKTALSAVDKEEQHVLIQSLAKGSYRDMLVEISQQFEIVDVRKSQVSR